MHGGANRAQQFNLGHDHVRFMRDCHERGSHDMFRIAEQSSGRNSIE